MFQSEETKRRFILKFQRETERNLAIFRSNLPRLSEFDNTEALSEMFLAAHTIKGNLGMMELLEENLAQLHEPARKLESIFFRLQKGEINFDSTALQQIAECLSLLENQFFIDYEFQINEPGRNP